MRRAVVALGAGLLIRCSPAPARCAKDPTIIARNILPSGQYGTAGPQRGDPGDDVQRAHTALRPRQRQRPVHGLQVREARGRHRRPDHDGERAVPRRHTHPRPLQRPPRLRQHRAGRHPDGRLDPRRGPRPPAPAGALQLPRRRHRRSRAERHRSDRRPADLQAERPDRGLHLRRDQGPEAAGKEGKAVLRDIDTYISGINAYLAPPTRRTLPGPATTSTPSTPSRASSSARAEAGRRTRRCSSTGSSSSSAGGAASRRSTTCASSRTRTSVTSIKGTFPYGHIPRKHPGSVVLDHNSFTPTPAVAGERRAQVGPRSRCRRATS